MHRGSCGASNFGRRIPAVEFIAQCPKGGVPIRIAVETQLCSRQIEKYRIIPSADIDIPVAMAGVAPRIRSAGRESAGTGGRPGQTQHLCRTGTAALEHRAQPQLVFTGAKLASLSRCGQARVAAGRRAGDQQQPRLAALSGHRATQNVRLF